MTKAELVEKWRGEIVEAAYKVFAEKGYHSAKISDIAQELKIGHGTFYRYFRNKLDIFTHVVDHVMERIREVVVSEDPTDTNNLQEYYEQVERIGSKLFDLFVGDPNISRILFYEVLGITQELNEKVQQAMDFLGGVTEQYLLNGKQKGFLRADLDTQVTALAVNVMILEAARRVLRSEEREVTRTRWTLAVADLMIRGMRA